MSLREPYYRELFEAGLVWDKRGIMDVVKASCKHCGATHEMNLATHLPPEIIIKKIRAIGWVDRKKAWTCLDCTNKRGEEVESEIPPRAALSDDIKRIFAPAPVVPPAPPPKPDTVRPSYRQIRTAMALIEGNFDVDNGVWLEGWSDDRLATEVGIERNTAYLLREDAFGPLKRPKELDQLLSEVKAATEMLADISQRVSAFAQRYR